MSRKPEPSSRRSPRRRSIPEADAAAIRPNRKISVEVDRAEDSDFGLCLALAPALRRRGDA